MRRGTLARIAALALALFVWAPLSSHAAELVEPWTNARALGMGNAFTAVVDGSESLFYNPAGLARSGGFSWTLFDPRVGANGLEAVDIFKEFSDSQDLPTLFNRLYGNPVWVGGGSKTAFQIGGLAFGAFAGLDAGTQLNNPAYPEMDLQYAADYGFTAGFGFDLLPGVFKTGVTARRITRVGTAMPIGVSTLATLNTDELEQEFKNRGSAYGLDVGFMITAPSPIKPVVALTWKNVGETTFRREAGSNAPARIGSELILGASLEIDAALLTITPSFDYKYANRENVQLGKKIHMGLEVGLPLIDIRAGIHQGYYTLGAGLNMGLLRVDAATYGVELGEYPGQLEDRRYIVQVSLDIGFDPGSFGFGRSTGPSGGSGSGGKHGFSGGRRLKQRR